MAEPAVKDEELTDKLYEAAVVAALQSAEGKAKCFSQDELLELHVVDRVNTLMTLVQNLTNTFVVRFLQTADGKTVFQFRTKDVATRLRQLSRDEFIVYEHIEGQGIQGMWAKRIKDRTGIVQTGVTKALKHLEAKQLIKQFVNVRFPNQKSYIVSHLEPSEGVGGGPWHADNKELDMELIGVTADAVVRFIEKNSWVKVPVKRERSMSPMPDLPAAAESGVEKKRKRTDDIEGLHAKSKRRQTHHTKVETQVSRPPGYEHYPTVGSILHFITVSRFIKSSVSLTEDYIQNLLDVLVFDERIEKMGSGYRTIRGVTGATEGMKNLIYGKATNVGESESEGNGFTQSPCGRCPVFDLCEEGGPISAKNCVYYEQWLKA